MDQLTKSALSKRAVFLATYRQQDWSFPDNIIYYITKYPSTSKCYQKMIQTCKHFFIKNPILVVRKFSHKFKNGYYTIYFNDNDIDINKITTKIWVDCEIDITNNYCVQPQIVSTLIPKIYKSDITQLYLSNQNISLNDLEFLASKCEKIRLNVATVVNENGSVVPLENIIEVLPNVKDFHYNCGYRSSKIISSKTVFELLKIPHFSNFIRFTLSGIPEAFDIEMFYDYIKKNKTTSINLDFRGEISDGYESRLQAIVDEIIENECREYKPPIINFFGINQTSFIKMGEFFCASLNPL